MIDHIMSTKNDISDIKQHKETMSLLLQDMKDALDKASVSIDDGNNAEAKDHLDFYNFCREQAEHIVKRIASLERTGVFFP